MHSETTSYTSETASSRSIIIRSFSTSSSDDESNEHTDAETDSSDDSDSDTDEYDTIHDQDSEQFYSEKETGKTYIGLVHTAPETAAIIMSNTVSARTYFAHPHMTILRYLCAYGLVRIKRPVLHVMTLHVLADGTYSMLLKTHWIRLVQRHWRNVYRSRRLLIRKRAHPQARKLHELTGKYPYPLDKMPSLAGMMSVYATNRIP